MEKNKCYFCKKRKPKYAIIIYPSIALEKEVETCFFCYKKYKNLKEKALINIHSYMINSIQRGQK